MRLTTRDVARIRELRYRDGLSLEATARIIGCSTFPVQQYAPGRPGKVDNTLLREAFLSSGLSAPEVAHRLGWVSSSRAEGSRVRRTLGLIPDTTVKPDGRRHRSTRSFIDAETAALMAEAIGVMPWEVGA